ncbi:MAG: citrate/2-methylcitrate synthase [Desulfobacterales bacterium]|nr:citrate/2-methylcitrate synthase [Desulfobacterales bacterium]
MTYDPGFGNTGSCRSAITFMDGEKGILRYRGIPIEELAETSDVSWKPPYLLINGHLPTLKELNRKFFHAQRSIPGSRGHEDLSTRISRGPPIPWELCPPWSTALRSFYPGTLRMWRRNFNMTGNPAVVQSQNHGGHEL